MSVFLEKFQQENQHQVHIIQLDNAPIHTAKKLKVPENIILLFQLLSTSNSIRGGKRQCIPHPLILQRSTRLKESGNILNIACAHYGSII